MDIQGDFYLPPCSREKCNFYLKEMAQAMLKENANLSLVTKDPPNNSIEESFKESFENCAFTIIHKCKHFWKGIQSHERLLLRPPIRVMCVTFRKDNRPLYEQIERHHAFFNKLKSIDVSTEPDLISFIKSAIDILYQEHPKRQQILDKDNESSDSEDEANPDRYVQWPDLFDTTKPTEVFLLKSFCKVTDNSPMKNCSNIAKLAQEAEHTISLPKLKCFILKVLPKLYADGDIAGLALLSVCENNQVANVSVLLLQLLLLKTQPTKPCHRINQLIAAEGLLFCKLLEHRQGVYNNGIESCILFSRLAVAYVMVLCDFILTCLKEGTYKIHTHLDTIEGRSLSTSSRGENMRNVCMWFDSFVNDAVLWKSKKYKDMLQKYELEKDQLSGLEEANYVSKKPPTIQTLVAYQTIKEIFQSMSEDHLTFSEKYVNGGEHVDASSAVIFQGLALFVVFQLRKEAVEDLESFCSTVMDVLQNQLPPKSAKIKKGVKVDPLLQILFFNPNPYIRAATFERTKAKLFNLNREAFLLNEILRVLFPLLAEKPVKINEQEKQNGTSWMLYKGHFGDLKAHIHLHLPKPQDLEAKLKTSFSDEDVYYNEMMMLEKLQHQNIIKMLAFQHQCIPQFYVLEHHRDLQSTLKNKTKNHAFADKSTLVKYILQALEALEFCHSKSIVHRNLTTRSLILVDEDNIKLSGFHLCLKMTSGEATGKAQTNSMIPTRWSAPESLKDNKYSVASDVWMFGHLIYEVLTHGGLPYADMKEGSELMEQIIKGNVHLNEHGLIPKAYFELINKCTKWIPQIRTSLPDIKRALEKKEGVSSDPFSNDRVDVDHFKKGYKPSTDHGKGIPTNTMLGEDSPDSPEVLKTSFISDTLAKLTEEHIYRFREKLVNMAPKERTELNNGALKHILPYLSIKENPQGMPHAEVVVERLPKEDKGLGDQLNSQPINKDVDGSLEKIALDKLLGESIKPYLECLYQAALLLEKLHQESWLIGDVSMPVLHIQQGDQYRALSVFLVSVAYLQIYEKRSNIDNESVSYMNQTATRPRDTLLISRAAPEVAEFGMFSTGSDIYCFGNLVWHTLMAFDCPSNMKSAYKKEQMETANFKQGKVSEKWEMSHSKPRCCPDHLYELMKECTQPYSNERISANRLAQKLERIIQSM